MKWKSNRIIHLYIQLTETGMPTNPLTKDINARYIFIKDRIANKKLKLKYVSTNSSGYHDKNPLSVPKNQIYELFLVGFSNRRGDKERERRDGKE